jgi:hypothetical protein
MLECVILSAAGCVLFAYFLLFSKGQSDQRRPPKAHACADIKSRYPQNALLGGIDVIVQTASAVRNRTFLPQTVDRFERLGDTYHITMLGKTGNQTEINSGNFNH